MRLLDTECNTLMILRTELNAVPHASLGYHFLRVQAKPKGGPEGSSKEVRPKAQVENDAKSRVDGGRSCLQSALAL